jgi:hypothetical protein
MQHLNLPVTPGAIIGYRKNGTPIRLIAGGSGEGDEGGSTTEGQEGGTGDSGSDGGQADDAGSQDPAGNAGTGQDDAAGADGDKTAKTIAAIRSDFKDERSKRQAAEKRLGEIQAALDADKAERAKRDKALAVALGLAPEDGPPDPVKLAEELERTRAQHQAELSQRDAASRQQAVELAVLRTAGSHGGNGDALLDSRSFMAKVNGLDPSADDFAEQLGDAIKGAVESSPQYKAAAPAPSGSSNGTSGNGERKPPAPSRSGAEHTTPGGNRQWTIEDVKGASPSEVAKAVEDGLLIDLGYSPTQKRR